jgi:hypothetical protein
MKYTDALKIYNEGKSKWCFPRKGSIDHGKVLKIQGKPVVKVNNAVKKHSKKKNEVKKDPKKKNEVKKVKIPKSVSKKPKSVSKKVFINDVVKAESKTPAFVEVSRNSISKKNSKAKRIQRFLKNKLVANKFTLDNRVKFSKYLQTRLKNISQSDCLDTKIFKDGKHGYTIKNVIDLVKKIGTDSAYGVIFLSSIKESLGGFSIVSKVMAATKDNMQEIELMREITDKLLLTKKTKHFAAVHKHAVCKRDSLISYQGKKIIMPNKLKLVSINELAHGDLKTLVANRHVADNMNLMCNLLFQVFISIGTFQNLVGYVHNDAHYGNFLYQMNNEKGYYEYEFNGKKYYLKACGYNMMIYDFGLSKSIKTPVQLAKNGHLIIRDYARIIHAFLTKANGWGNYYDVPTQQCEMRVLSIKQVLTMIIGSVVNVNKTPKDMFKYILENALIPFSPTDMFMTSKPKAATIINSTPYKIG